MSTPSNYHAFPLPHVSVVGQSEVSSNDKPAIKAWKRKGTALETSPSNLSRSALRVIDRSNGKEYSLDELGIGERNITLPIALIDLKQENAWKDALPDTPDGNGGTLGLADTIGAVVTGTSTNNTSATEKAGFLFRVPDNYRVGTNLTLRIRHKFSVARTAASALDAVVKRITADGALDATDLVTTSPIDCKTATDYTNRDFTINGNASGDQLAAGTLLWVEISQANIDTGGSVGGVGTIAAVSVIVPSLG